jgi:phosphoribosylglycinamide formyltransferase-1
MKKRLAVFVSGAGTTLDALCEATKSGKLNATIDVVISNRLGIKAGEVAKKHGVVYCQIPRQGGGSKDPFDAYGSTRKWSEALYTWAEFSRPDLIILAGFDQRIYVPQEWQGRILNTHPSLLPKFGGKGMYGTKVHEAVFESGELFTGCTVHVVDNLYDHGVILAQSRVPVLPNDTPKTIQDRVQKAEREMYPLVINDYEPKRMLGAVATMNHGKYLPLHWHEWLADNKGGRLSASDFDGSVVIVDFEDGSSMRFNYAFYVVSEEHEELAVFTEHCGYYVFPIRGLKYRKLK